MAAEGGAAPRAAADANGAPPRAACATTQDLLDEEDLLSPPPDLPAFFAHYAELYFGGLEALGGVSVEWSSARMTLCGGTTERVPGGARIKLSRPLLSLRPLRDLKDVLLHEMIHAEIFLKHGGDDEPTGHGTRFMAAAARINASADPRDHARPAGGYQISVHHDWLAEVEHFRQHHWRCGRCGSVVKRAANRPPQEADCPGRAGAACRDAACNFHAHVRWCGGDFVKTAEPEGYVDRRRKRRAGAAPEGAAAAPAARAPAGGARQRGGGVRPAGGRPITDFFGRAGGAAAAAPGAEEEPAAAPGAQLAPEERRRQFAEAAERRLGGAAAAPASAGGGAEVVDLAGESDAEDDGGGEWVRSPPGGAAAPADSVACPLCGRRWPAAAPPTNAELNAHVDACLRGAA
jgi:hypothetical protein